MHSSLDMPKKPLYTDIEWLNDLHIILYEVEVTCNILKQ